MGENAAAQLKAGLYGLIKGESCCLEKNVTCIHTKKKMLVFFS